MSWAPKKKTAPQLHFWLKLPFSELRLCRRAAGSRMGKDGKKRRRSVGKLQTRDDRPQAIRARQAAAHQNTSDTEQLLQQQLEAYHSENRSCVRSS